MTTTKTLKRVLRLALIPIVSICLVWPFGRAAEGDNESRPLPAIVQAGLTAYASGGPGAAVVAWRKGGALEADPKTADYADDFKEMEKAFGNYKTYELIETKEVSKTSKLIFLAMNFERGAAFASFLVFKTNKDWVVQDMDFDISPATIMPWLAVSGIK